MIDPGGAVYVVRPRLLDRRRLSKRRLDLFLIQSERCALISKPSSTVGFGKEQRLTRNSITRRRFLQYVGAGASLWAVGPVRGAFESAASATSSTAGIREWTPVAYPIPSPGDGGSASTDAERFARFLTQDDLLLPKGFRYDIVAQWGDLVGPAGAPDKQFRVGFAADYTGLVPIPGARDEYFLIVNHEYISGRPWVQGYAEAMDEALPVSADGRLGDVALAGGEIDFASAETSPSMLAAAKALCDAAMRDLGLSVLHVRRDLGGRFDVIRESDRHLRVYAHGWVNLEGPTPRFTGPAQRLLARPKGTFSNCSGATTPWGTFLSCEENVQDQTPEHITPAGTTLPGQSAKLEGKWASGEESHPTNLPFEFEGLGNGLTPALDGREYGWVVEVDPFARTFVKHTALGRFRHENVSLRVEAGKPLVAYMGDDRRGGQVWKFVSEGKVADAASPANGALLEKGTLYAAKFNADFSGHWVPITPATRLKRPEPQHCAGKFLWLPSRPDGGHVSVGEAGLKGVERTVEQWIAQIEEYAKKPFDECTLRDLVDPSAEDPLAILLMDAHVMANAVGATNAARPEDVEVHPADQSVYIAFTDSTGSGEGSPDVRIFPDSRGENSRQYGAIYRIIENNNDPAARTFAWGKFVSSGETSDGGGAFASADNLAFDPAGNLWVVSDITTPKHNFEVSREDKSQPGTSSFMGVFGNNAMFCIATSGEQAGVPRCFAIGPMECELTGPTWTEDGRTLLLSVQHPGELHGTRGFPGVQQPTEQTRKMRLADRAGAFFDQERMVPIGSNFPSRQLGVPPRPCVVCITQVS